MGLEKKKEKEVDGQMKHRPLKDGIENGIEKAEEMIEKAEETVVEDMGKAISVAGEGARRFGRGVKVVERKTIEPIKKLGKRAFHGLRPISFFERIHFIPRYLIKVGIPFLLLLIFVLVPEQFTGLDRSVQNSLGIFVCIALLWTLESLPLAVTALLVPALLAFFHVFSPDPGESVKLALQPFANPVIYLIMGGMMMSESFRKHGLDRRIAYFLLSKTKNQISLILFALMGTAWFFSMWISNTATVALLVPVTIGIAAKAPENVRKHLATLLLLGIGTGATLGGMGTLVGSSPNAVASALLANEVTWTFMSWMKLGFPIAIMIFFVAKFVLNKMVPVDITTLEIDKTELEAPLKRKLSRGEKGTLIIMAFMVIMWMFSSSIITFTSGLFGNPLPQSLTNSTMVSLIAIFMLFATKVLDWQDVKMLPWDVFLIIGAGLALGQGLIISGAAEWMAQYLGIIATGLSLVLLMFLVGALTAILTNFVSNTAVVSILVPILITLSNEMGLDPKILVMTCALAASISLILTFKC